jgi:hypothetical protein
MEEKPLAIICDLDSTLCDIDHREIHATKKDWDKFHSEAHKDKLNAWCAEILEAILARYPDTLTVFFITGRPERVRHDTEDWLRDNLSPSLITHSQLYMRPDDDYKNQPNGQFKCSVYREHIKDKYEVMFVMDDQVSVVNMWRNQGLVCLQPENNDY